MRTPLGALWRLIFKRCNRIAREAKPYNLSQMEACPCNKFTGKPQQYTADKGWRLLAHIGYTDASTRIEQTHDAELDEDILERIDFLACLFAAIE